MKTAHDHFCDSLLDFTCTPGENANLHKILFHTIQNLKASQSLSIF